MSIIEDLQNKIKTANDNIKSYRIFEDECNRKIKRLEKVYNELGDIKDAVKKEHRDIMDSVDVLESWRGDTFNQFLNEGDALDRCLSDYYSRLDAAQDAVNTQKAIIQGSRDEKVFLIGPLLKQIDKWTAELQNWYNNI